MPEEHSKNIEASVFFIGLSTSWAGLALIPLALYYVPIIGISGLLFGVVMGSLSANFRDKDPDKNMFAGVYYVIGFIIVIVSCVSSVVLLIDKALNP